MVFSALIFFDIQFFAWKDYPWVSALIMGRIRQVIMELIWWNREIEIGAFNWKLSLCFFELQVFNFGLKSSFLKFIKASKFKVLKKKLFEKF
jgi:hypothetical protein